MTTPLRYLTPACLAAGLCMASLGAQAQNTKAPKVQLWMDLSTGTMAGMPEMDSLPGGGGMLGGLMGGMGGMNGIELARIVHEKNEKNGC